MSQDSMEIGSVQGLAQMALATRRVLGIPRLSPDLKELIRIIFEKDPVYGEALASSQHAYMREELLQLHAILHWAEQGMPVFDLTHGLCSALLLTDPADVDASEIRLPFGTFVVRLPQPFWEIEGHTLGQKWPAAYAIVHTWLASPKPPGNDIPLKTHEYWANMPNEQRLVIRLVSKSPSIETTTQVWEILPPIPEEGSISSWIQTEVPDVVDQENLQNKSALETLIATSGDDKYLMFAFRRLLVNLCLYISEKGRGERLVQPRRPGFKKRSPETIGPDIWVLGREIKLDKELLESARAWTSAQKGQRDIWKIRSRFTIRGHWRMQAHGPAHSLRRRQWIAPYWKGQGAILSHIYTTKETP